MQWLLQRFDDTLKLAEALDQLGIVYSWHKVIPFIGELVPEPIVPDTQSVVFFGSYSLWKYSAEKGFLPGVIKLNPFVHEKAWHPYLLNGTDALFITLRDVPNLLKDEDRDWFIRPVNDSKEEPGNVKSSQDIIRMAENVLALKEEEIPDGSLRHDTELMLTKPVSIFKEWRLWVVSDQVVAHSLYRDCGHVTHRAEIDADVMDFAREMVSVNPGYATAYVMDICRTEDGLKIIETNCINAAGFYAADLIELAKAIEGLSRPVS